MTQPKRLLILAGFTTIRVTLGRCWLAVRSIQKPKGTVNGNFQLNRYLPSAGPSY